MSRGGDRVGKMAGVRVSVIPPDTRSLVAALGTIMESWLSTVCRRLTAAGFVILDDVAFDGRMLPVVARRTRFELTKFGFSESFVIFEEFDRLTTDDFRAFSADAFRCAKRKRVIPLPCGLFESVWCYSVAIAKAVDKSTVESVESDTPPMHWASAEIPVVYDLAQARLAYFQKTPLWGYAYYAEFRRLIQRLLGEDDQTAMVVTEFT